MHVLVVSSACIAGRRGYFELRGVQVAERKRARDAEGPVGVYWQSAYTHLYI